MIKRCPTCKIDKDGSEFHRNSAKPDGFHNQCKACRRGHYDRNRDDILAYNKSWNDKNPERIRFHNINRAVSIKGRAKGLWLSARSRAQSKGLEFSLSLARIEVCLMIGTCERTGIRFDFQPIERKAMNPFAPSIDKVDPYSHYTDDNIKIVCWAYNIDKHQMSHEEFVAFCRKVVEFNS